MQSLEVRLENLIAFLFLDYMVCNKFIRLAFQKYLKIEKVYSKCLVIKLLFSEAKMNLKKKMSLHFVVSAESLLSRYLYAVV